MSTRKIAITIDEHVLQGVEELVREGRYKNRSNAIESAVREKVARANRSRLIHELSKLDAEEEQDLADEINDVDADEWPEY